MDVIITKGHADDLIEVRRPDGRNVATRFPKKGPVPHDAVHFIVEETLRLDRGFWGMIAAGEDPDKIQLLAKAAGHASAKRATLPDAGILQLLQAERTVEAAEAALWSGGTDIAGMRQLAETGCLSSHVPAPDMTDEQAMAILSRVVALRDHWAPAAIGHQFQFRWAIS